MKDWNPTEALERFNKRSDDNKECKYYKECIRHEYCGHCYDHILFDPISELDIAMNKIINEEDND